MAEMDLNMANCIRGLQELLQFNEDSPPEIQNCHTPIKHSIQSGYQGQDSSPWSYKDRIEAASPCSVFRELEERSQGSHNWPSTSSSAESTSPDDPSVTDHNIGRRATYSTPVARTITKTDNSPQNYFKTYGELYDRSEVSPQTSKLPGLNLSKDYWNNLTSSSSNNSNFPHYHSPLTGSTASSVANSPWPDSHASESPGTNSLNSANDSLNCYPQKKTLYTPRGLFIQTYQDTPTHTSYLTKCGSLGLPTLPLPTVNITRRKLNKLHQPATQDSNGLQYLSLAAANLSGRTISKCGCTDQAISNTQPIQQSPLAQTQERNESEMASRRRIVFEQLQYPLMEQEANALPSDDCVVLKLPLIQKPKGQEKMKVSCNFCMKNGESAEVYMGHPLKRKKGKKLIIVCPILRSLKCNHCGATGDDAHTETYCPVIVQRNNGRRQQATTITVKSTRIKSNGQRRY